MDETPNDSQDDLEFDPEVQHQSVAVAPNPELNGHVARSSHVAGVIPPAGAKISYVQPVAPNGLIGRINNRPTYAAEKKNEKDDRDFLDTFNLRGDAGEYQLACTRYQPNVNADGDPVPTGINSKHVMPVMSYDELQQCITDVWGGGAYRVTFLEENGRRAENIQRGILINIPTTQYPAKREKFEKIELFKSKPGATAAPDDDLTEDAKRRRREFDDLAEEYRRQEKMDEMEARKTERELKKVKREKEIEQMRREIMAPREGEKNSELILLEKRLEEERRAREEFARKQDEDRKEERRRYEEDRKESQRRADEDRKVMMDALAKQGELIREVANRPPPPPDNAMEKILTVMAPIVAAIVNRPPTPTPDNTPMLIEMQKASAEAQRNSMQMVTAIMSRPNDDGGKMLEAVMKISSKQDGIQQNMINGMFTALLEKDKGQVLTPQVMQDIQDRAEKRIERLMGLGGNGQQQGGEGDDGETGYDPALGFLGNAGKALFGSLKALMDSAATNPQLMELAMKVIGSRNPTNQQLAQVAYQWDQTGVPPTMAPALMHHQQPQLPHDYQSINQQAVPYPAPPVPQQRTQAQRMPPPMPGVQSQNPAPAVAPQHVAVLNELEGESSGIPSNGDPVEPQPMTPEEMADENLKDAVTQTVEIMIGEAVGKPDKRTWPEYATEHWNKDFIAKIVACPFDGERLKLIGTKCDNAVAIKMNTIWQQDPTKTEMTIFWNELHRFVDMNMPQKAAPAVAPTVVQQSVPVVVATPSPVTQ